MRAKNSRHGATNPNARYPKEFTVEDIMASAVVADPLHLLEICATSDGGAAVVLASTEFARRHTTDPVRVAAISTVTPTYPQTVLELPAFATDSAAVLGAPPRPFRDAIAHAAYEQAGLGPDDLDLAEVYDLSSALELDWYENIGLCPEGEAERLLNDGDTELGGRVPVNPSRRAGLLRRGDPGPGDGPGVRDHLAAAGPGHRPPGRGRPRRPDHQPGPLRPRLLGHPRPLT